MSISISWVDVLPTEQLEASRNADGDTIYFCHSGSGEVYTDYGLLKYERGSYIVIPKCLTHVIAAKEKR